jgi:cytidylate kinase
MMSYRIVTIDGPAGAGKTTVSKALSKKLGCIYVDTGALYRAVAYEIAQQQIDWKDDTRLAAFLDTLELNFSADPDHPVLLSSGIDISGFIRTPEISMLASDTSANPLVRQALLGIQQQIGASQDAVFEGRDMGTIVFPDAPYKFFLSADLNIRARRRYDELSDEKKDFKTVQTEMKTRDTNDSSRKTAPLKSALDAVIIDSSHLSVDQVVEKMVQMITATP